MKKALPKITKGERELKEKYDVSEKSVEIKYGKKALGLIKGALENKRSGLRWRLIRGMFHFNEAQLIQMFDLKKGGKK